ncbi:MAG TPA: sugar ABC transporter permease [Solirubrobacteraceae bacterium]|jgi:N,N'-diacetylchitobiose transport system permease protein|nr:sugar ABC transporter permease [Solirubrobacteraceae bacterium]
MLVAVAAVLGYPIVNLVELSLQRYGLFELIQHHGIYIGLANFSSIFSSSLFWHVLIRTVLFTAVNVGLTIGLGMLIALLLGRVSTWVRLLITVALVLVWSTPPVVGVEIWQWMTNVQNGVLNYALTQLHVGNFLQHDWYTSTLSQYGMVTSLLVWGALPFVAITLFAALSQVPDELVEAAQLDGANVWRAFVAVTLPVIRPVLLILISLSIIWDFGVFTQPFLLIGPSQQNPGNYLMSVYLYEEGYGNTNFGLGAAISIVMLVIVAVLSIFYVRAMVRVGDE